ncbi:MAG: nucleoside recognition domain-containing protein [Eubacteriales bacterium]|nr:nucleoside recognition domain-containing protein [Eubacteriales bacterium]
MDESWLLPALLLPLLTAALFKRLPTYDLFVEGCKTGLRTAVHVLPNLLAMMVALSFMNASGLTEALCGLCAPLFTLLGLPPEVAPLAFLRPLSGSAALAAVEELMARHGPDSRVGLIACTIMGSSETIFYTICVYLGAIREKRSRYAVPCALIGTLCSMVAAGRLFPD